MRLKEKVDRPLVPGLDIYKNNPIFHGISRVINFQNRSAVRYDTIASVATAAAAVAASAAAHRCLKM